MNCSKFREVWNVVPWGHQYQVVIIMFPKKTNLFTVPSRTKQNPQELIYGALIVAVHLVL